jgi:hypothetical protein
MVPELRKVSRQQYLKQREEQVISLYKQNLADEIRVFGADPDNLTSVEKRITELKTNLLKLADKRREKEKEFKLYSLPDADNSDEGEQNESR